MIVQPSPKCGVRGDLGVADAQIGIGGVVAEAVFARAALDQCNPLAAQALIGEQCGGRCQRLR